MESQRINILLNRYFEATSTVEEENELNHYFTSSHVEEELKPYIPMFARVRDLSPDKNPALEEELMNYILNTEARAKGKSRRIWQIVTGVAAVVMLAILAVNFYTKENQWQDTFNDPRQAYMEASKTLQFVASKYNEGLVQLQPLKKVEQATIPLHSGMQILNDGLSKLNNIENLTTNIQKE